VPNFGLISLSVLMFILKPIVCGATLYHYVNKLNIGISFTPILPSLKVFKESMNFLSGMSLITIIAQIYNRFPKIILGIISGPGIVAIYSIVEKIRTPITLIQSAIIRPFMATSSDFDYQNKKRIKEIIIKSTKYHGIINIGLSILIILYINEFILLWLGSEFTLSGHILRLILFFAIIPSSAIMLMMYYAQGYTKASLFINSFNTLTAIVLSIFLIRDYELWGLIISIVISSNLAAIIGLIYFCRFYNINIFHFWMESYLITYFSVFITVIFSLTLKNVIIVDTWFEMICLVSLSSLIYSFSLFLMLPRSEVKKIIYSINN